MKINVLDIIFLIILGIQLVKGYIDGMIKSILGIASFIISIIVAKMYYLKMVVLLKSNFDIFANMKDNIYKAVTSNFAKKLPVDGAMDGSVPEKGAIFDLADLIGLGNLGVSNGINDTIFETISTKLAGVITNACGFLLVFVISMIVFSIVIFILDNIMKLPILEHVNRIGGIIVGLVKGVLYNCVLITIVTFVLPLIENPWLMNSINDSYIVIHFYNNNILLYLIYFLIK